MADSFFGFDTSLSNLNDDEGGGEPSEDEYDALNDETFGQADEFDWEVEHEQLAEQLESSRRHNSSGIDDLANTQLEASLSQLVLDETDAPHSRAFGSSVWRHDPVFPTPPTPVPALKNVCTVEELERQLRQKQQQQTFNQNYFQPRFPPVILQRPPGLQAPVPLPFAPQQPINHGINQMNQPLNKMINQMGQNNQMMPNHVNPMGQNSFMQNNHIGNQMGNQMGNQIGNQMGNQMGNQYQNNPIGPGSNMMSQLTQNMSVHQMGQTNQMVNQMGNQMGQNLNMTQSMGQLGQNMNQMGQNMNQMGQNMNQMGQNVNQMGQNMNQMGQNLNPIGSNVNQMGQNMSMNQNHMSNNQMGNHNQMGPNMNQMGQNHNQMMPNGNQFPGMNQFPHMMGQPRMMAPPPGLPNMPRQNFNSNMPQYNPNFRVHPQPEPPNMMMSQPMLIKNQQQPTNIKNSPSNQMLIQSPQNKNQNQNQNQALKPKDQKLQRSRVYNNSKIVTPTPQMTSQNLVQLIQNTHPMLQFNSFHNANHHPMLNNRSNAFPNAQFNHPMFSQRVNGTFNNRQSVNGDDASGSDSDEYAGLMTAREKQWLVNIQMLQLNTGTPYIHDFYYTVFLERQASKEKEGVKEAHKANQQNHPFYSGGVKQESHTHRERHNSNRHNSTSEDSGTPRTYVPTQFENSLGKLQCGSVTAPRKIIDVEVVGGETAPSRMSRMSRASSVASTTQPHEVPREMKRTKQLLLDIEALYLILLRLEELNDPLAISNALILKEREEKQKQLEAAQKEAESEQQDLCNLFLKNIESVQRRPKQDSPKSESIDKRQVVNLAVNQKPAPSKNLLDEDKEDLVNKMFAGLLHSDRLQQMLSVRKGRTLITRFVRRVSASHVRLRSVWARALRALPSAARRDDGSLAALAPHTL
ncbi:unnamed protein product [Chrysodeixis includens]|uniref:Uncharacterized protein n=1 Tax=Chrysodeixis includens TaxID=689277 RepID=A0A9N8L0Z0_CHRIL|nr:unnamed protein product [Chrysodeixis includens]